MGTAPTRRPTSSLLASALSAAGARLSRSGAVAGSVAVVSGQDVDGEVPGDLARVAAAVDTLVVLMAVHTLERVVTRLLEVLDPDVPAAVIAAATTDDQRIVRAPLAEVAAAAREAHLTAPATLVVGRVVNLLAEVTAEVPPGERRTISPRDRPVAGRR